MSAQKFFFNGINGSTGEYLLPPLSAEEIAAIAKGETFDSKELSELKQKKRQVKGTDADFAPMEGIDPKKLEETGWGVIFSYDVDPAIKAALQPLLNHRKQQATQKHEHYYQEFSGPKGYRPGESKSKFLARHGVGPGPADPDKMPYYLLIVGDPQTIPYRFQYQLDVQYAVGRIHFDTPEEYAQYAQSVVQAETGGVSLPRTARFFGVRNSDDPSTQQSAKNLVKPLVDWMEQDQNGNHWAVESIIGEGATKEKLETLLGGEDTPALLFTASHGMGFDHGDSRQLSEQGALICQDWPGPKEGGGSIPDDYYFSSEDISDDARLLGLVAFFFACYGAGTPQFDEFSHKKSNQRLEIAPYPFVAPLPKRLLSHPKGGALAVVGHVDRAWGQSFQWEFDGRDTGPQLAVFQSTLKRLLEGHTVGSAVEYFNERYAELSSDLSVQLEDAKYGGEVDANLLSGMWTANNDARGYAIIGDPAVKLPVEGSVVADASRPILDLSAAVSPPSAPAPTQAGGADGAATVVQAKDTLNQALDTLIGSLNQDSADQEQLKQALSATAHLLDTLKELL